MQSTWLYYFVACLCKTFDLPSRNWAAQQNLLRHNFVKMELRCNSILVNVFLLADGNGQDEECQDQEDDHQPVEQTPEGYRDGVAHFIALAHAGSFIYSCLIAHASANIQRRRAHQLWTCIVTELLASITLTLANSYAQSLGQLTRLAEAMNSDWQ